MEIEHNSYLKCGLRHFFSEVNELTTESFPHGLLTTGFFKASYAPMAENKNIQYTDIRFYVGGEGARPLRYKQRTKTFTSEE